MREKDFIWLIYITIKCVQSEGSLLRWIQKVVKIVVMRFVDIVHFGRVPA